VTLAQRVAPDVSVVRADAGDAIAWAEAQLRAPVVHPVIRVTVHASIAVVSGCAQRPSDADRLRAHAAGIGLWVRSSGGGAVLAGPWMLGASVALPPDDRRAALPLVASYAWLGTALVRWLGTLGVAAESASGHAPGDESAAWACFARLSCWEPHVGGRKIAGLAQVRRRHGVLYTAGVLLSEPPWALLCAVLGRPFEDAQRLGVRTTCCAEVLGRPVDAAAAATSLGGVLAEALC
jgi:lipoate-protein ligase A